MSCLSYRHGAPTQRFTQKPRGIRLLNAFCWEILHKNVYKDCLPPGRVVFSPDEQTVPVLRTEHSPPYVGELPSRIGGSVPWKRTLLASLFGVHPNYAPAHIKAELLDEKSPPVTSPVEMLFWIHVQPGWSIVYQKGVITAREICIELTLFNSEARKDEWECGSGPESKDEISGQETTSTISFWIKAGVCVAPISNTRYMNALLWRRQVSPNTS